MTGPARGPGIVGRTYLEYGRPVLIGTQWGTRSVYVGPAGGPRHARIRREDGSTTIRPLGGLRRPGAGR